LRGALLLPSNYQRGTRYPLIVYEYPGAKGYDRRNEFGLSGGRMLNMQLLASRGYAVLAPEIPLHDGTHMVDIAQGVLAAVDRAVELGIADSTRLGVIGHSYGGYGAVAVIAQTSRFKAAVAISGISNVISEYAHMMADGQSVGIAWAEWGQVKLGGTPWTYRERYIENSPFFKLDRVTTPLLLVHGGKDTHPPPRGSEETFIALQRLRREVTYVRYDSEGHVINDSANLVDFGTRMIDWFDRYISIPPSSAF
jgi:dipeptidyl aminopeptidase/acylaminoacyl peptidase